MVCTNCGQETNGIKINGKSFCTHCGEPILMTEEPNTPVDSKQSIPKPPSAKIITPGLNQLTQKEEEEIRKLQAEEEALELIEKEAEQLLATKKDPPKKNAKDKAKKQVITEKSSKPKVNKTIIKHERTRVSSKNHYDIVKGEPDPISKPELESPHDVLLNEQQETIASKETETGINFVDTKQEQRLPLLSKEEKEVIRESHEKKANALRGFFQKGVVEASKKSKKPKKKKKTWIWFFASFIIILLLISGLVLYVNTIGTNGTKSEQKAEKIASFVYTKPDYIPYGYEIHYTTGADSNSINYVYEYAPDKNKKIVISVEKSDMTSEDIYKNYVMNSKSEFTSTIISDQTVYFLDQKSAFFTDGKAFYQVLSSDTISTEELLKIVEGIL